jgi:multidrug resistance efflux pump
MQTGEGQILFDEDKPPALKALEAKRAEVKELQAKVTGLNAAGSSAIQAETQLAKAEDELGEAQKQWDLVKLPPNKTRVRQYKAMMKTMCANIQHHSSIAITPGR